MSIGQIVRFSGAGRGAAVLGNSAPNRLPLYFVKYSGYPARTDATDHQPIAFGGLELSG